ncbi:hypothetical protein ACJX0J_036820, partial [Zea mays]
DLKGHTKDFLSHTNPKQMNEENSCDQSLTAGVLTIFYFLISLQKVLCGHFNTLYLLFL